MGSFQALVSPADMLKDITFIDTPGVLAGNKQRIGRDYEFARICNWMAERADLVLLTFDAHKLDISDEFQEVMEVIRPYADKVRCVLNKADQIDASNLVRVYGALLWNVGKVLRTPEVARVFVSSFWDQEYRFQDHKQLFDEDKQAILEELRALPRTATIRKINAFVLRVRRVKAHYCIMMHIRASLPWASFIVGANERLKRWLDSNLEELFKDVQRLQGLGPGDMPNLVLFREKLQTFEDISKLPALDANAIKRLDDVIDVEVPKLLGQVGGVSSTVLQCRERKELPSRGRLSGIHSRASGCVVC